MQGMKNARLLFALLLLVAAACGYPRPADVGDDGGPGDAPDPGVTIRVSPSGDDASDGLASPVKTLKRAIAIAGTNTEIKTIALAAGRYSVQNGESFPYIVPNGITISGVPGGGSTFAGTRGEDGLRIENGQLQDLGLEDFMVATAITGRAELTHIAIRSSKLAVRAEAGSKVTASKLELVGAVDACGSGVELRDAAELVANELTSRNLLTTLDARNMATVELTKADITGDPRCTGNALWVTNLRSFTMRDSSVVGTYAGIALDGNTTLPPVVFTNTTIRNINHPTVLSASRVTLTMIGGEISLNSGSPDARSARWMLMNVRIVSNGGNGVYVSGPDAQSPGALTMRGCTVTNNRYGVSLFDYSAADLGTDANPGNNIFQDNQFGGVLLYGIAGPQLVNAVGNTWIPEVQGASGSGRYPTTSTVSGPIQQAAGNNFEMWAGLSLRR